MAAAPVRVREDLIPFTPYEVQYTLDPKRPFLGKGFSGRVYKCLPKGTESPVALKVYLSSCLSLSSTEGGRHVRYSSSSSSRRSCGDHLLSLLEKDHPNIVSIHKYIIQIDGEIISLTKEEMREYLTKDDEPKSFIIKAIETEYIDGENITEGARPLINVSQYKTIIKVMNYLYENNLSLGGDLTGNIMVDRSGAVKFIDFAELSKGSDIGQLFRTMKTLSRILGGRFSLYKEKLDAFFDKFEGFELDSSKCEEFLSDTFYQELISSL
jgi:serine/threonine protein kinase